MVSWWPIDNQTERVHTGGGELSILARVAELPSALSDRETEKRDPTGAEAKPDRTRNRAPSAGTVFSKVARRPPHG